MNLTVPKIQPRAARPLPSVDIRPMRASDLVRIHEIECASFRGPWSIRSFREILAEPVARCTVAVDAEDRAIAYAMSYRVVDEVHLLNFAVDPEHRREGVGSAMLADLIDAARADGGRILFLEVRPSNEAAIALYRARGLHPIGVRRGYYSDDGEDALVLAGEIT